MYLNSNAMWLQSRLFKTKTKLYMLHIMWVEFRPNAGSCAAGTACPYLEGHAWQSAARTASRTPLCLIGLAAACRMIQQVDCSTPCIAQLHALINCMDRSSACIVQLQGSFNCMHCQTAWIV
jgi:hypothetical protein